MIYLSCLVQRFVITDHLALAEKDANSLKGLVHLELMETSPWVGGKSGQKEKEEIISAVQKVLAENSRATDHRIIQET